MMKIDEDIMAIQNNREYEITKEAIKNLEGALNAIKEDGSIEKWLIDAQRNALNSQIDELKKEVAIYENQSL